MSDREIRRSEVLEAGVYTPHRFEEFPRDLFQPRQPDLIANQSLPLVRILDLGFITTRELLYVAAFAITVVNDSNHLYG